MSAFVLQMGLLLVCSSFYSQNPSQIDVLTTDDGLLFRHVNSVVQDGNGLMYFATSQGITRYDGYDFKVYNSDRENPFFIEEENTGVMLVDDTKESLWYLANDKLFSIHLTIDSVKHYGASKNIKGKVLRLLKTEEGSLWVITDDYWKNQDHTAKQYLQKYTNGRFEVMASIPRNNRGFSNLVEDQNGFLWWSTPNATLKYDTKGHLLATYDLVKYDWYGVEMHFTVSFFDSNNTHYYFPHQGGINSFEETNQSSTRILETEDEFFYAIEDHQNHIWFAGRNVLKRRSPDGDFVDYTKELKSNFDFTDINSLFIDANNLLWVSTDNGLFKVRIGEQLFTTVFKSENAGWGHTMRGVFEDHNASLFALCESENKLFYKSVSGRIDTLHLKLEDGSPIKLENAAGFFVPNASKTEVFATGKTLLKINLETGRVKDYKGLTRNIKVYGTNPMIMLNNGNILLGYTLSRLLIFNPKTEESELVFKPEELPNEIANLKFFKQSEQANIVWVGTQDNGLLKLNLNGTVERIYDSDSRPQISKNHILVVEEDQDGSLWVGTYGGGLNHISADGSTVKVYTKSQGLPDNNIVGILTDDKNNLWISTYNGLAYFDKDTKIFQNFYTEDGLSHNEFNYSSFYKSPSGEFYFGGMNGLNAFKPEAIIKTSERPILHLTGFSRYNSKAKGSFETDYNQTKFSNVVLSPYDQYFEVNWTMPSYFQNNKNTYSTKLEGFEDRWFYQGNSASIRYNQLPAGDYVLKVKGKDSRGNEAASMLSIPITVRQIFYKQWWFRALILMAIIAIMYSIFRYRLKQALAMERLRTKISSDLHDDVGSLLSGLAMQTELMEINASEADKFKLQKIAGISRNAISQMRDLVWSIDSRRETIKDLMERMQELAEELLLPKDISFHIDDSNIKNPNRKLPAQTKQHIFLIYKEALTNILRHSNATNVNIIMLNDSKGCEFIIRDNGAEKKFYKSTGLGLSNMVMRAEKMKGNLKFQKSNGFAVHLHLPFNM
ncbi:ligand-binding sensor domain-containing protein [Psychroserpens sp.]|uniref:ligand-binding sensor domain-containing protein n=1 Tax=Psychroserpens sp. TaxID=2020870 RepID=UPI003C72A810